MLVDIPSNTVSAQGLPESTVLPGLVKVWQEGVWIPACMLRYYWLLERVWSGG
jgi:hypothetical protein